MIETIKDFLWTHPWWHATLVIVPPILVGIYFNWTSGITAEKANKLSVEANRLREESKTHIAEIADLQEKRNKLQTELNALQSERNSLLEKIAHSIKQPITEAEKNAVKLRKYLGKKAFVSEGGGNWGSGGAEIVEVNEDNILTLFTPAGYSSSTAWAVRVRCDELQIVEEPQDGCALQIRILKRYGDTQHLGNIKRWEDRASASDKARPRGRNVFSIDFNKQGSPNRRSILVFAPVDGNPQYTLVTVENGKETSVIYDSNVEISKKCAIIQINYRADGFQYGGGSNSCGSTDSLFIYTH